MINLYEENETNFKHNAYVLNEIFDAYMEEEINSNFDLSFKYPVNDKKGISTKLIPGSIIKVPTWDKRENQLFVINRYKPSLDNMSIDVSAQHILLNRLDNYVVLDTNIVDKTRKEAIKQILDNTTNKNKFSVGNKDTNLSKNNLRIVRYSALDSLIGDKSNTIINRYGGELIFNNFNVDVVDSIGEDTGIKVTYAKNITGATMTLESTDIITEIIPLGKEGLMLPEKSIKASNFDKNNPYTKVVEFRDIGVVEPQEDENGNITNSDEICTEEEAIKKLRQACLDKFNIEHVNQVSFNLDLNFIELADCINFDGNDYSGINRRVSIGDTIDVYIKPFGIVEKGRIYKIKRNPVTGELLSAEIGYKVKSLTDTINKVQTDIEDTKENLETTRHDLKVTMKAEDDRIILSVENLEKNTSATFEIMEKEIATKVTENDMWTSIKQNPQEILFVVNKNKKETSVTIDSLGLTVENGKIQILCEDGSLAFKAQKSGGLKTQRLVQIVNSNEKTLAEYTEYGIFYYDENSNRSKAGIERRGTTLEVQGTMNFLDGIEIAGQSLKDYIKDVTK